MQMPTPNQEPSVSSKAPNQDLMHMDDLCTLKIKTECQNLEYESPKDQWLYPNTDEDAKPQSGNSSFLHSPKLGHKGMDVLWTLKIKTGSQNLGHGCTKDHWPYQNQYPHDKPHSGTSSVLQSPKSGLKGHWCSLHLQNQDREPKFGKWVYQRSVTISKLKSRCQKPVRKLQHRLKPQMRT